VDNGLSQCTIHIAPSIRTLSAYRPITGFTFRAALLEDDDGPMRDVLKGFHDATIELPERRV
jgi:hypothetical protein